MNRFQYDNIPPTVTALQRERALTPKGINRGMSEKRRAKKQARHRANRRTL